MKEKKNINFRLGTDENPAGSENLDAAPMQMISSQ